MSWLGAQRVNERFFLHPAVWFCVHVFVCCGARTDRSILDTRTCQQGDFDQLHSVHTPEPLPHIHTHPLQWSNPISHCTVEKNSMLSIDPSTTCTDTHTHANTHTHASNSSTIDHSLFQQGSSLCHVLPLPLSENKTNSIGKLGILEYGCLHGCISGYQELFT